MEGGGEKKDFYWKVLQEKLDAMTDKYIKLQNDYSELYASYAKKANNSEYQHQILGTISDLLENETYSDMTFVVGGVEIPAHRLVIHARCKKLLFNASQLQPLPTGVPPSPTNRPKNSEPQSLTKTRVDVSERISEVTFRAVLHFIYRGHVIINKNSTFALDLLTAAAYYDIQELKIHCERVLLGLVTTENCIQMLQVGHMVKANDLVDFCLKTVSLDFKAISKRSNNFEGIHPDLVVEIYKKNSRFPLHLAIEQARKDVILNLLASFRSEATRALGEINKKDDQYRSPLQLSLQKMMENARSTLSLGTDANSIVPRVWGTELSVYEEIAEMLLEYSADINDVVNLEQDTLLLDAINSKNSYVVSFLLKHNVDCKKAAQNGDTPLHRCAFHSITKYIKEFLSRSAAINAKNNDGMTALHVAIAAGNVDASNELLSNIIQGADPNIPNNDGNTPLHTAARNDRLDLVKLLLRAGATATAVNAKKRTALHECAEKAHDTGIVDELLRAGLSIDLYDENYNSPIHLASFSCNWPMATQLVRLGANVCVPNKDYLTPLDNPLTSDVPATLPHLHKKMLELLPQEPGWLPDRLAPVCQICKKQFNLSVRRHHCRHCGRVVCDECSPRKALIEKFPNRKKKPTRVCVQCFDVVTTSSGFTRGLTT